LKIVSVLCHCSAVEFIEQLVGIDVMLYLKRWSLRRSNSATTTGFNTPAVEKTVEYAELAWCVTDILTQLT